MAVSRGSITSTFLACYIQYDALTDPPVDLFDPAFCRSWYGDVMRRRCISVVATKGGVGKTIMAVMLAHAAHRRGVRTAVVDLDPQGSAMRWDEVASGLYTPVVTSVDDLPPTAELVVVDTPPGHMPTIRRAIEMADVVLIPTTTSPADVDRAISTATAVGRRKAMFVLSMVDLRSRGEVAEARQVLGAYSRVATTMIPARSGLRRAWGSRPDEVPESRIFDELFIEVNDVLGR